MNLEQCEALLRMSQEMCQTQEKLIALLTTDVEKRDKVIEAQERLIDHLKNYNELLNKTPSVIPVFVPPTFGWGL
jgi:hypothetical protein